MQKLYKIEAIYLFLTKYLASFHNCNVVIGNLSILVHKFENNWKMLNGFYCQFVIWKSLVICHWKIQLFELFNSLIWFYTKNVELKIEICFRKLNTFLLCYLNWLCKKELNWKKVNLVEKLNYQNIIYSAQWHTALN